MCEWVQLAFFMSVQLIAIKSDCNEPIRFYDNKYCRPIRGSDPRNPCPEQFDCSNINPNAPGQCFYAGGYYQANIHEEVDYSIAPSCGTSRCQCQRDLDFDCLGPDCDYLPLPDYDDCYYTYSLEQCCATGYNCKSNSSNTFRCNVEGTYYHEGEIFYPPNAKLCKSCVCNRNWRGQYDESVCNNIPCEMELWHSSKVMNFCAPVYYNIGDCCPSDFYCPTASDERTMKIFRGKPNELHCRFGKNLLLRLGTKTSRTSTVDGDTTITKCECKIPPYMTCYRTFQ